MRLVVIPSSASEGMRTSLCEYRAEESGGLYIVNAAPTTQVFFHQHNLHMLSPCSLHNNMFDY